MKRTLNAVKVKRLVVDCLPEVSRHLYMGHGLLDIDEKTPPAEMLALGAEFWGAEPGAVLPGLKAQVESMLGDGNFLFEFSAISKYGVTLYWLVNPVGFDEALKQIYAWLMYEELDDLIVVDEEPIDADEYKMLIGK